jgi:hypothetical protein
MTALTRVALACGAALIMATAALGALHTGGERETAAVGAAPARTSVLAEPEMPSASELDLDPPPGGVWATR